MCSGRLPTLVSAYVCHSTPAPEIVSRPRQFPRPHSLAGRNNARANHGQRSKVTVADRSNLALLLLEVNSPPICEGPERKHRQGWEPLKAWDPRKLRLETHQPADPLA